jgi:hypothetical protein
MAEEMMAQVMLDLPAKWSAAGMPNWPSQIAAM